MEASVVAAAAARRPLSPRRASRPSNPFADGSAHGGTLEGVRGGVTEGVRAVAAGAAGQWLGASGRQEAAAGQGRGPEQQPRVLAGQESVVQQLMEMGWTRE